MTQENKDLLLKDLSGRLPCGVILNCCNSIGEKLTSIDENGLINHDYDIEEVKPYLFPLGSLTEEQLYDVYRYTGISEYEYDEFYKIFHEDKDRIGIEFTSCYLLVDWCNKNHIDYRNLISKNLALDVTELNIY